MVWIGEVLIPPEVAEKLWIEHQITEWEVRQLIHDEDAEAPRWDEDPVHGGRAIVRGFTRGTNPKRVYVALRPVDWEQGLWAVITAFVPEDEEYGQG
jgi:hypothetical protein